MTSLARSKLGRRMSQLAETRRLALTPRRAVGIACAIVVVALNFYLFTLTNWTMLHGGPGADWLNFTQAGDRVLSGGLYVSSGTYAYRYSPLLAYLFSAISLIGPWAWRGLHLLAALAMPGRWLKVAVLLSWPFWFDVEAGNLVVFTLLLAAWALRGRAWAIGGFLVLSLLIPRPLMLPVLAWLLWKHQEWWLPFAALFVGHAVVVAATGWGPEWIGMLISSSTQVNSILNFGPSRLIGLAWLPIGLAIAGVLAWRGRLGLASVAASPYWLPYYFLFLFLEWPRQADAARGPST